MTVRQLLSKQSDTDLANIGKSYSIYGTRDELITKLVSYFKDYGIVAKDLLSRYPELKN